MEISDYLKDLNFSLIKKPRINLNIKEDKLKDFRITQTLGQGSFGAVYEVERISDPLSDNKLALKKLKTQDFEVLSELCNEA